jgi:hypothetical protein
MGFTRSTRVYKYGEYMKDWIRGIYYKIPFCCIKDYVLDIKNGLVPGEQRLLQFGDATAPFMGKYVPCRECAGKTFKEKYEHRNHKSIVWMIHNCPMTEMPNTLRWYIEKKSKKYGLCQEVCLTAIDEWIKGIYDINIDTNITQPTSPEKR